MDTAIDLEQAETIKPRNAWIAFLLSIFTPGLGQIYNSQISKAILFIALLLIHVFLFGYTRWIASYNGFIIFVALIFFTQLYIIADAVIVARKSNNYILKSYNKCYYYVASAIGIILLFNLVPIIDILGVRTFAMPAPSMEPTVMQRDRMLADFKAYENQQPQYGDMVVYREKDGSYYMKRVVGLPGDEINFEKDNLSINGISCPKKLVNKEVQKDYFGVLPEQINLNEFEETLPNGKKYNIYKLSVPYGSVIQTDSNFTVPENSYFVLGDNRDNSHDSRITGAVHRDKIVAKLLFIYWNIETGFINKKL